MSRTKVTVRREDFIDDLTFNAFLSQTLPPKPHQEPLSGGVNIQRVEQAVVLVSWDEDDLAQQPQHDVG